MNLPKKQYFLKNVLNSFSVIYSSPLKSIETEKAATRQAAPLAAAHRTNRSSVGRKKKARKEGDTEGEGLVDPAAYVTLALSRASAPSHGRRDSHSLICGWISGSRAFNRARWHSATLEGVDILTAIRPLFCSRGTDVPPISMRRHPSSPEQ